MANPCCPQNPCQTGGGRPGENNGKPGENNGKPGENSKSKWSCTWCWIGGCCFGVLLVLGLLVLATIYLLLQKEKSECGDFYDFVCSNAKTRVDRFELDNLTTDNLQDRQLEDCQNVLNLLGTYIDGCQNTNEIDKQGIEPLQRLLTSFGGLPLAKGKDWSGNERAYSIMGSVTKRLSTNGLFNVYWGPNFFKNREPIITLGPGVDFVINTPPSISPRTDIRIDPENYEKMISVITDIAKLIAGSDDFSVDRDEVINVVKFWYGLNVLRDTNTLYNATSFQIGFFSQTCELPMLTFFKAMFEVGDRRITDNTDIIVMERPKVFLICKAMRVVCGGSRTVTNFVLLNAIRPLLQHSSKAMRDLSDQLNQMVIFNPIPSESRKEVCYFTAQEYAPLIVTVILYRDYYTEAGGKQLVEMIDQIKDVYFSEIENNEWLTRVSKDKIKQKIQAMRYGLYFPSIVQNGDSLNQLYVDISLNVNTHFDNLLALIHLHRQLTISPNGRTHLWLANPMTKAAWQVHYENKFYITAALLKSLKFPDMETTADRYGTLGFIIAHVMAMGVDTFGISLNSDGNSIVPSTLLDTDSYRVYSSKIQAIANNFHTCPYPDICTSGWSTRKDSYAYLTGIKMSYLAFTQYGQESVSTDDEQRFFTAFAELHCEDGDRDYMQVLARGYDVNPNAFRQVVPMQIHSSPKTTV